MKGYAQMLLFLCFLLLLPSSRMSIAADTISPGQSIRDGSTLVSTGNSFVLGFFSPGSSTGRYVGIWYKKVSTETVVWVANREAPVLDHSGVLNFTNQGILVLFNSTKDVVWSSNRTRIAENPIAQLLDSGNFVVREANDTNPGSYLWQSFDYPGDTSLPGQKLGRNLVTGQDWSISSWKSLTDPARGDYTVGIDPRGFPQLVLKKGDSIRFRAGSWNGVRFTGATGLKPNPVYRYQFVSNEKEVYFVFELINSSVLSRLGVDSSGLMKRLTWIDQTHSWAGYFAVPKDQCDFYSYCGPNTRCNGDNVVFCECPDGFVPKSERDWSFRDFSGGCVRKTPLACNVGEGFVKRMGTKLPDASKSWFNLSLNLKDCEEICLKNCSCTAYANSDITGGGSGCVLWFGDLVDMRDIRETGQDMYIRMSASYIRNIKRERLLKVEKQIAGIVCSITVATGVILLVLIIYTKRRKRRLREQMSSILGRTHDDESRKDDLELPVLELNTIAKATDNFSSDNKLGEGGFGPVYKGILPNGQEIAAKRLSLNSGQGLEEFKNEVLLIAKLQHRNLVKLLACCIERDERMLIYEYMRNKSLDYFIFDESRSKVLGWNKRSNIIDGIARGLLYLHQDSRLRIIHRDLKASNILLDDDLNPKISDFGMARIFGGNQTEANTNRVVGTFGYMAPEYAVDGLFSVKSDIFSFGVLVLEIVSGKKNRGFYSQDQRQNLVGHAWRLWMEERPLELIQDTLNDSRALSEIIRYIHVGLLCVQQQLEDRPNMSTVVLMLGGESSLPQPREPGFFMGRKLQGEAPESSGSNNMSVSTNEITVSMLHPR